MVDAASTEGRDPIEDVRLINDELKSYNPELAKLPQVIAANKLDVLYGDEREEVIKKLKDTFEPEGLKVFPYPQSVVWELRYCITLREFLIKWTRPCCI